jgi:hypothetical protein
VIESRTGIGQVKDRRREDAVNATDPTPEPDGREGTDELAESLREPDGTTTADDDREPAAEDGDHTEDAETRAGTWADESPENYEKPED